MKEEMIMGRLKKADQEMLKSFNRHLVFNYIRRNNAVSRAEITEKTQLSPTTVSIIVSELLEDNLILNLGVGRSSGGRKPLMLGVNPKAKYVISIILRPKRVTYALVDLGCNIVERHDIEFFTRGKESAQEILEQCINELFAEHKGIEDKLTGVGISIPGIINNDGTVLYSASLDIKMFEVMKLMKERVYDTDYFVFKDTDALILGEKNFGKGKAYSNFAYIMVEDGIGMSYVSGKELFKPSSVGGLELGHMIIDPNGPLCRCGTRGCLGTTVSEDYIVCEYKKMSKKSDEKLRLEDIVLLSNQGDNVAKSVLKRQAGTLGLAIANILNMFNPEMIIVGGPISKCKWNYLDVVSTKACDMALDIYRDDINMVFSELDDTSALIGMANDIFEKAVLNL